MFGEDRETNFIGSANAALAIAGVCAHMLPHCGEGAGSFNHIGVGDNYALGHQHVN